MGIPARQRSTFYMLYLFLKITLYQSGQRKKRESKKMKRKNMKNVEKYANNVEKGMENMKLKSQDSAKKM